MIDNFSVALQKLYSAASDASLWPSALQSLEDLMKSSGANINLVPLSAGAPGTILTGRLCPDGCAEYARDYMDLCPRLAHAHRDKPDLSYDGLILTEYQMDRDPVYDFFRKQGFRYHIGSALPNVGNYQASFSFQRTPQQGHVQAEDIAIFKRIRPHMVQAITLANALDSLKMQEHVSLSILDRLPQGFIVVGAHGELMFANAAAEKLLSRSRHLRLSSGKIEACNVHERGRWAKLIADASGKGTNGIADSGGWLRLEGNGMVEPLAVFAAPVTDSQQFSFTARPAAIILPQEMGQKKGSMQTMLCSLFALTPTEARLASLLAATIKDAAEQLTQTSGTARGHLKAIFQKMDVNRQQDLVARLIGLAQIQTS